MKSKYALVTSYPRTRRWSKGRNYDGVKTCPMSRHAAMIADSLRNFHSPMRRALVDAGFEVDHIAKTLEETVSALWDARRFLEWRDGDWLPLLGNEGIEDA